MPWMEKSVKDQREEFVRLARAGDVSISELCRRFGISRPTAYKWRERYDPAKPDGGLADRSSRPLSSPSRSPAEIEQRVLALREEQRTWGGRKIARVLEREQDVRVAPSTAQSILKRNGCISDRASQAATRWQRFEHAAPNDLWQIDFKGCFPLGAGSRCHPLTVLDDHSRYNVVLKALERESRPGVQAALTQAFERYGLPWRINADNGPPWGSSVRPAGRRALTGLEVWLIRLGIEPSHSRPNHPQTNGKDERFHRTLKEELLAQRQLLDMEDAQCQFDQWRHVYNHRRPHQALNLETPSQRYASSQRPYPAVLPPIEYMSGDVVRKVDQDGWISFKGQPFRLSRALRGNPVALRPDPSEDGVWQAYFCSTRIARIDTSKGTP
jgi:transposase InsO family protein